MPAFTSVSSTWNWFAVVLPKSEVLTRLLIEGDSLYIKFIHNFHYVLEPKQENTFKTSNLFYTGSLGQSPKVPELPLAPYSNNLPNAISFFLKTIIPCIFHPFRVYEFKASFCDHGVILNSMVLVSILMHYTVISPSKLYYIFSHNLHPKNQLRKIAAYFICQEKGAPWVQKFGEGKRQSDSSVNHLSSGSQELPPFPPLHAAPCRKPPSQLHAWWVWKVGLVCSWTPCAKSNSAHGPGPDVLGPPPRTSSGAVCWDMYPEHQIQNHTGAPGLHASSHLVCESGITNWFHNHLPD